MTTKVEVRFAELASIEFQAIPGTLRATYRTGMSEEGKPWKGELFDESYVGFSGFTDIGETFVWAKDVTAVRFDIAK